MWSKRGRVVLLAALVGLLTLYAVVWRTYVESGLAQTPVSRTVISIPEPEDEIVDFGDVDNSPVDSGSTIPSKPSPWSTVEESNYDSVDATSDSDIGDDRASTSAIPEASGSDSARNAQGETEISEGQGYDEGGNIEDEGLDRSRETPDAENNQQGQTETEVEMTIDNKSKRPFTAGKLRTSPWHVLYSDIMASDTEKQLCLERYRSQDESILGNSKEYVHQKLAKEIRRHASKATCLTSKNFLIWGSPHFTGGRRQYLRYFNERGWHKIGDGPKFGTNPDLVPPRSVLFVAACSRPVTVAPLLKKLPIVSMAASERASSMKVAFFTAVKGMFDSKQCGYTHFFPESYLVDSIPSCKRFLARMMDETDPNGLWFLKIAKESFGAGITVRTHSEVLENELSRCDWFDYSFKEGNQTRKRILFQRGVENIFKFDSRITQGRAYLLISGYEPASAWLMMGYFNVAKASMNISSSTPNKEAHVTNLMTNQDSKRLLFKELGLSMHDSRKAFRNIKRAALTVFHVLRPHLEGAAGSYTLLGFDYVLQEDMQVKVLETNCNCELFANIEMHGKERVDISTALMDGMMDSVVLSRFAPSTFAEILATALNNDARSFVEDRHIESLKPAFELVYSEAVDPPFAYANIFDRCAFT